MKVVCVGGGPAGLYFATLAKLHDKNHDVAVVERNAAHVTYGWGVVFWDHLLDNLYRNDPVSAREIRDNAVLWHGQQVHVRNKPTAYLGGYGFSMGRKRLLDVLTKRAMDVGVDVHFGREAEDLTEFADADLVIGCDGANSRVRQLYAHRFQPSTEVGRNKYIWLGTHKVFDAFTFAFEQTAAGWIWCHAYPFDSETSTFIVECPPESWAGLGFDELGPDESIALLEDIFKDYLGGHCLMHQGRGPGETTWLNFKRVSNGTWHHENVVLMGDAAHTTHFAIGSGTKLAIEDAIGLVDKLHSHGDLQTALESYEAERRAALLALQSGERNSTRWFEDVRHYIDQGHTQIAYALENRRGVCPRWRYVLHLLTQILAVRTLERWGSCARRWARARRREGLGFLLFRQAVMRPPSGGGTRRRS